MIEFLSRPDVQLQLVAVAVALVGLLATTAWGRRNKLALRFLVGVIERVKQQGTEGDVAAADRLAAIIGDVERNSPPAAGAVDALRIAVAEVDPKQRPPSKLRRFWRAVGWPLVRTWAQSKVRGRG